MTFEIKKAAMEILRHPDMQRSKQFIQHGEVSVYEHSVAVAQASLVAARLLNRFFHVSFDCVSLVRGALLHDFFLYDWHSDWNKLHGFYHPDVSFNNAVKRFPINKIEEDIIRKHMFPLTLFSLPRYRESWLVCMDKYVSLRETVSDKLKKFR